MEFTLMGSNTTQDANNCVYPVRKDISSRDGLVEAVVHDYVCATYTDNYRRNSNFISSNVIVMDCDNDMTDDPSGWVNAGALKKILPDNIAFAVVPSRNNNRDKKGRSARPRFHVFFPISTVTDPKQYADLKHKIYDMYPFFDRNALDAGRFFFGHKCDACLWRDGDRNIDDFIRDLKEKSGTKSDSDVSQLTMDISADGNKVTYGNGSRNSSLYTAAISILKRYGDTADSWSKYMTEADKCIPRLDNGELKTIWDSALKFYKGSIANNAEYIAPEVFNKKKKTGKGYRSTPQTGLAPDDYTDLDEAKAFLKIFGSNLRYSPATNYLVYNGRYWEENGKKAEALLEKFLDLQLEDARKVMNNADTKEKRSSADEYMRFVLGRRSRNNMASTLTVAEHMVCIDVNELDKDPFILNTPEGTFDIRHGSDACREHCPDDLLTKITECGPGDKGKDIWEDALEIFFCGDKELIDYVQQVVGLAAIGKVESELLIISYGKGANGKSTFWNTIAKLMGTYSGHMSADALTAGCRRNVKPELAELKGRRLIIAAELEEGVRLSTSMLKIIASTDGIHAEKKYKAPFTFTPSHIVVLYTNHLPKVGANDDGTWRRLKVIPFNAKITGKSDIKNYSDYLCANAGPYIMKWIMEGARKVIENGCNPPEPKCIRDAIMEYREQNDWLGHFLDECCITGEDCQEKSGLLYTRYRNYCRETTDYIRSTADFYSALQNAGFNKHRTNKGNIVQGLKLKEEDEPYWARPQYWAD